MCEFLLKQRDSQYRWWSTLSRISNKEWQYWVNLASLSQVPITKLKNPLWLKCRDTNRRHPLAFFTIFPLSIRAVKPLLPQVPAHALSTRPRFNKDFYSHARTECTAPGLRRWHRAGSAGSQAHLGKGYSISPGYPTAQRCQGAKEELHFVSYSDSGSSTKITGICYLDCNLDRDFRIQKIRK